jgi:hypothetical protein
MTGVGGAGTSIEEVAGADGTGVPGGGTKMLSSDGCESTSGI